MQARGIEILYGRWLIEGAPRIVLINTKTGYDRLNEWKADLWDTCGIPSPEGDDEMNETVVFGYLVTWFLGEVCRSLGMRSRILANELAVCLAREIQSHRCPVS